MKYVDFKSYKFSTVVKKINALTLNVIEIFNFKRLNWRKFQKKLNFSNFNFFKIEKQIKLKSYKLLPIYFIVSFFLFGTIYLSIPSFYTYNKSDVKKIICADSTIKCSIKGKINYSFFPNPRINIKQVIIQKNNTTISVQNILVKLSVKNLLKKENQNIKKIEFENYEINIDKEDYKIFLTKKINFIPIEFSDGIIKIFENKNNVVTIDNVKINLLTSKKKEEFRLRGKFLNDNLYLKIINNRDKNIITSNFFIKMSNSKFLAEGNFLYNEIEKNIDTGNVTIKKNKNKFSSIFNYKNDQFNITNSNFRNSFLDGKIEGEIKFHPFFSYNLELILNSINFTKMYNNFLKLNDKDKKKIFSPNNKINGRLNISADKVYSKHNLVKSFESRIKFYNGNISIDQLLINLGKLGATDISGVINNDKELSNFKFEKNIFVDNEKKFLSKFGIYNKKKIPPNLFISGNLDLKNTKLSLYEISDDEKLATTSVNFIENEFNNSMLFEGYTFLFDFPKFKQFIKLILNEED